MATTNSYNANAGSEAGSAPWTNPTNAWNGNTGNYAAYDIPAGTGKDETNHLLISAWDSVPGSGDSITKVEIGVYTDIESGSYNDIYVKPKIGGSTEGDEYDTNSTTTAGWHYRDITSDSQAPSWTWSDIQNLDVKVYGRNGNGSKAQWVRVHSVLVRVTSDVNNPPINKQLHYYKAEISAPNSDLASDDFNDNSLDAGIWTDNDSGGTTTETGQQLEQDSGANAGDYASLSQGPTTDSFDVSVKVVSYTESTELHMLADKTNSSSPIDFIAINSGALYWRVGTTLSASSIPSTPFWLRMAYDGSTMTVYSSTDGSNWTHRASDTPNLSTFNPTLITENMGYSTEHTINYTSATDEGNRSCPWTNVSGAVDGSNDNKASADIDCVDGGYTYSNYLLATANDNTETEDTITNVRVKIEGWLGDSSTGSQSSVLRIRPIFNGSTIGEGYDANRLGSYSMGVFSDETVSLNITNDNNAPNPWTWSDINNLDIRVYGYDSGSLGGDTITIDNIGLSVTTASGVQCETVWDDFVNRDVVDQAAETGNINIYTTSSGITDYMNVCVSGTKHYIPIDSNTSHANASNLRIRKNGTTYAVLTERE